MTPDCTFRKAGHLKKSILIGFIFLTLSAVAEAASPQSRITISAVGDIMMGTNYPSDALPAKDGADLFRRAMPAINAADIRFGNLEGPLFDGEVPEDGKRGGANRYIFRTPTRYGQHLQQAGFNVMALANNHARDFGMVGLISSKRTLQDLGIQYSSKDADYARFDIRGTKVALIATDYYTGSRSITNPASTYQEIRELKKKFDLVIVYCHAGGEGSNADHVRRGPENFMGESRGDSIGFAHAAVDAGADALIMSGPHVPRAIEVYRGHLIIYSLGNFVTERGISINGKTGLAPLVRFEIDGEGRFLQGQLVSFLQTRNQGLVLDPSAQAQNLIQEVSLTDFPDSHVEFGEKGQLLPRQDSPLR